MLPYKTMCMHIIYKVRWGEKGREGGRKREEREGEGKKEKERGGLKKRGRECGIA